MHRRNEAERCIRTAKNHIIASLANMDPNFPLAASKFLFEQAEITLNLLRPSPTDASKSAWEDMHGRPYDFNRHPLAPPGTRVVVHDKHRSTWAPHGIDGFYVGPKLDGHRMFQVYIPRTRHVRTTDTLSWHFNAVETQTNCPHERLAFALKLVARAIQALHPDDITSKNEGEYRAAAETATKLSAQVTAAVHDYKRGITTSPVAAQQTLPPVIVPILDTTTRPDQRVAVDQPQQRVAADQSQQRVAVDQPHQQRTETAQPPATRSTDPPRTPVSTKLRRPPK